MTVIDAPKTKKSARYNGRSQGNSDEQASIPATAQADQMKAAQQHLQDLTRQLEQAEKLMEKPDPYAYTPASRKKRADIEAKISDLKSQMAVAEVDALPLPAPVAAAMKFQERNVAISTIRVTGNHREIVDQVATAQLARSLQTMSLQQRIGLRDQGDGTFELIWGSRRLAAAKLIGWEEIPAKIFSPTLTATEVEILRTIENFGRKDLTHVERAMAVARVLDAVELVRAPLVKHRASVSASDFPAILGDDPAVFEEMNRRRLDPKEWFGAKADPALIAAAEIQQDINAAGGLHAFVGQQLGFPAKWVRDNAYVSKLGGQARKLLAEHRIDVGHAREIAKVGDPDVADGIAEQCARDKHGQGGRDVKWCAARVVEHLRSLRTVPWRLDVAFGAGKPGCTGQACATCRFNSKSDPDLFGGALADEPAAGVCTNEACFHAKQEITDKDVEKATGKTVAAARRTDATVNETLAQQFVPIHVKPATVMRKAQKEMKPAEGKGGASAKVPHTPEDHAKTKLDIAIGDWEEEAREAMNKAIRAEPIRFAMLCVLQNVPPFREMMYRMPPEDLREGGKAYDLLMLATGHESEISELCKLALKNKDAEPPILEDAIAEFFIPFIDEWKLKVPPMPRLEDFLPGAEARNNSIEG